MSIQVPTLGPVVPLPPPTDLGFGAKFSAWRAAQIRAVDLTIGSSKRFVGIVAPCGFGKALYGMACTRLLPGADRSAYLTSTRGLQDQAHRDFHDLGLVDVRGQQNYPCIALEPGSALSRYRNRRKHYAGCDEGPCHVGVRCYHAPDPREPHIEPYCGYYSRVWKARRADLVSTNYAYWLTSTTYGQGLGEFDLLVLDEAHNAIEELERFLVFDLSTEDAGRLSTKLPDCQDLDKWAEWGATYHRRLTDRLEYLDKTPPNAADDAQERRRLKNLHGKLERLGVIDPAQWIVEREQWRVRFSPLDVRRYAEEYLFHLVPKVVLMSATLTEKTLDMLGIPAADREIFEFPSTFPPERRPVYAFDMALELRVGPKMTAQEQELWLERIDRIIETRQDRKGIIHAVSYDRARYIYTNSRHRHLMLFHEKGDTQVAVDAFKLHEGAAILVSPSIMTGFDFPGIEARYQIIAKLPILDPRGPIMQARIAADPEYSWYVAMQKLEQAVGRSTRSEDDWSEVFICDDNYSAWFHRKATKFATKAFLESVRYVSQWPAPLSFPESTAA